ncbi:Reverse transcriptase domain-containing protein [Aphis craccivora]|uniref:Reverse transcriptase domain-containing protein n=1 Tax=Aphis craccivora TaxID=307492 RepID=A0A6G0Z3I6_APHCR|nr:Reverse transcriptase domain-containing protein [Aphis craccivora]
MNNIQILQNKFLRICLKGLWFMKNRQIHNDTGIPLIQDWIKIQFKNFYVNLNTSDDTRLYNLDNKTKKIDT